MKKENNSSPIQNFVRNKAKFLLSLLIFLPLVYVYSQVAGPATKENLEQLEKEIKQIKHIAGVTLQDSYVRKKLTVVLVTEKYSTKIGYEYIFEYYKNEFKKNGWIFCCTLENSESKDMLFKKKDYTAYVTYVLGDANKLIIDLSWGLGGCDADCKD